MADEIIETPAGNEIENEVKIEAEVIETEQIPNTEIKPEEKVEPPILNEPVPPEPVVSEEKIIVEKIGNKTIEKSGDTVTITEVMTPPPPKDEVPKAAFDTKFPAPFVQKNLWQKFLNKLGDRKSKRLEKIMQFLEQNKKIKNDEVEKLLHVSDATATRYLDELEKQNKIRQVGKTGKYTYYEKI